MELMRTYSEPSRKSSRLSVKPMSYDDEIEIIDIDDDEPNPKKIDAKAKPAVVEITKMSKTEDEELLLVEDDDIRNEESFKKRKPIRKHKTPNLKKVKVQNDKEKSDDMVEVKSSSGKSMFVNKATLEKIMASKVLKKAPAASERRSMLDEKLLAEKSDLDVTKKKSLPIVGYPKLSPKKTRSRGF